MLVVTSYLKKVKPPRARPAGPRIKAEIGPLSPATRGGVQRLAAAPGRSRTRRAFPPPNRLHTTFTHHGETHTHTLKTIITSACRHSEREKPKSGPSHKHQVLCHVCASLHVMCHLLLEEPALRRAKHGVAGRLGDLVVEGLERAALRGPRPPASAGGGRGASAAKVPLQQLHCPSQLLG